MYQTDAGNHHLHAQPTAYAAQPTAYAAQPTAYAAQPKIFVKVYFLIFQVQPNLFFQPRERLGQNLCLGGFIFTRDANSFHAQTPKKLKTHPRDFNPKGTSVLPSNIMSFWAIGFELNLITLLFYCWGVRNWYPYFVLYLK